MYPLCNFASFEALIGVGFQAFENTFSEVQKSAPSMI